MEPKSYTVTDPNRVKDALDLNYTPVGLNITKQDPRDDSCTVQFVPPTDAVRDGLEVSDSLLQELLDENAIKPKET